MSTTTVNGLPKNFPTKPRIASEPGLTFPSDLFAPVAGGKPNNFFTSIRIQKYNEWANQIQTPAFAPEINLPIPRKINDVQVLTWSQESTTSIAASLGVNLFNFGASALGTGITINPYLFLMFKHPNFKAFELSWTFAPENEQESRTIAAVIDRLKFHSSPEAGTVFMYYPDIFWVKFHPDPFFTFRIKPCIIEAIGADYTGGDVPAFYKNGAPVAINLSVRFKEIEIWEKGTWYEHTS